MAHTPEAHSKFSPMFRVWTDKALVNLTRANVLSRFRNAPAYFRSCHKSGHSVAPQYLSLWADCVAKLDEEQIANKNKQ